TAYEITTRLVGSASAILMLGAILAIIVP
ncbi:hypothetical protein, partial [Pseudomonas aeruginosa]